MWARGVRLHSVSWEDYWGHAASSVTLALERLHRVWRAVVSGNADAPTAESYARLYQELLHQARELAATQMPHGIEFLRLVVAFEAFELVSGNTAARHCAATFSSRHPLLAAESLCRVPGGRPLRSLPLIALRTPRGATLFSYYRQHSLPVHVPTSLLLYLPAANESRPRAYETLRSFAPILSDGSDPFARERARRIWGGVIEPALRCFELGVATVQAIEVVDIGMGNGDLTRNLAAQLALARRQLGMLPPRFHVWGVDLDPGMSDRSRSRLVTFAHGERADCRAWLDAADGQLPAIPAGGLRVGLLSKVFDALTAASVRPRTLDKSRTSALLSPHAGGSRGDLPLCGCHGCGMPRASRRRCEVWRGARPGP